MFGPDFTGHDVRTATMPEALARGQGLAALVEDLDWDEYSLGRIPGEGIGAGELLVHRIGRRLTGEWPGPDGNAEGLCAHTVACALAFLSGDTELADRLAARSHREIVAFVSALADRSAWARQAILVRLDARIPR